MMLLLNWKGVNRWFVGFSEMQRQLKLTHISEETRSRIEKASKKGVTLYGMHNPYVSEMSSGEEGGPVIELMVGEDLESLTNQFHQLRAEI